MNLNNPHEMEPVVPFSVKVAAFFCLLLHLGFFTLEAAWFPSKTATFKAAEPAGELIIGDFTTTGRDNAKSLRIFAFNMGCYNLLLAAGVAYSLAISWKFQSEARTLLTYLCCVRDCARTYGKLVVDSCSCPIRVGRHMFGVVGRNPSLELIVSLCPSIRLMP